MGLHATHLNGPEFFVFAALAIASALASVLVADARRRSLSFFFFSLTLGAIIYLEAGLVPALAIWLLGVVSVVFFLGKKSTHNKPAESTVTLEGGPNRPVALFISLCFVMIISPIWGYSVWRGHAVTPLSGAGGVNAGIWENLSGTNIALTIGMLLLSSAVIATMMIMRPQKAQIRNASDSSNIENQSERGNQV